MFLFGLGTGFIIGALSGMFFMCLVISEEETRTDRADKK